MRQARPAEAPQPLSSGIDPGSGRPSPSGLMRTEQFGTRPVSVGSYGCWSHMDEAKPLPSSTAPTSQARPMIASVEWQNLWAAAGGGAGGGAIVYVDGAAGEGARLVPAGPAREE